MRDENRKRTSRKPGRPESAEAKLRFAEELVPQLARAIGPLCEVVLHESTSNPPTIRAIGNGHITNREVGDLMTQIIVDGEDATNRDTPLFNYESVMPDGRHLRVSVIPIADSGKVIGYIAVNFLIHDLAIAMQALSVLAKPEPHAEAIDEKFTSPRQIIADMANEYVHKSGRPIALLDKRDRVQLVQQFKERGVFRMRGAMTDVAQLLGVSRTAVYNYLSENGEESLRD